MKQIITIISISRSGTEFFCDLIDNSFTNINVSKELFHNVESAINNKLLTSVSNLYNINYTNNSENNIRRKLTENIDKNNPIVLLEHMSSVCQDNIIMFKIFPYHLNYEKTKEILKMSSFVIFLKRNYIDNFISTTKAINTNKYMKVDTSNIKIYFDKEKYILRKELIKNWFSEMCNFTKNNNIQSIDIDYDTFHMLSNKEKQLFLNTNIFCKFDCVSMKSIDEYKSSYFKQDTKKNYKDKIINYDDFLHFITTVAENDDITDIVKNGLT